MNLRFIILPCRYFVGKVQEMAQSAHVEGFDAFKAEVEKNKGKSIFALFSGSLGPDGKSWCPDCVTGELTKVKGGQRVR